MTGKNKKELQSENVVLKEELSVIKSKFSELSDKYELLQKNIESEKTKKAQEFKCEKCDKIFETYPAFQKHKDNHKELNDRFPCEMCERDFDEEWKMRGHIKMNHNKNECHLCGKSFKFVDTLTRHVKITHENVRIYCHYFNNRKVCPFEKDCIFIHELSENCKFRNHCERNFCMYQHESIEIEEEVLKNDEPSETLTNSVVSVISESTEEVVNIDETCNIIIESGKTHKIEVAIINPKIVDIVNDENLDDIKIETSNRNVLLPDKIPSGQIFKCEKCDFAATRRSVFNDHKVTSHNWCNMCFSNFNDPDSLKTHMKTHSKKMLTGTRKSP